LFLGAGGKFKILLEIGVPIRCDLHLGGWREKFHPDLGDDWRSLVLEYSRDRYRLIAQMVLSDKKRSLNQLLSREYDEERWEKWPELG
jgi:hypothetical protein